MAYNVKILPTAEQEVDDIVEYLMGHGINTARRFFGKISATTRDSAERGCRLRALLSAGVEGSWIPRVLSEAPLMKQIIPFSTSIRRSKRDFLLHLARVHILPVPRCAERPCRALCYLRYKFGRVLDPGPPFTILE